METVARQLKLSLKKSPMEEASPSGCSDVEVAKKGIQVKWQLHDVQVLVDKVRS